MTRMVLKWPVAVDDQTHAIGAGPVVHVGSQGSSDVIYVWTEESTTNPPGRGVQVYGTGHPIDARGPHLGSVVTGPSVWHVYEVTSPASVQVIGHYDEGTTDLTIADPAEPVVAAEHDVDPS